MKKIIAGLGIFTLCTFIFLRIHQNVVAVMPTVSTFKSSLFGKYGTYLKESSGFGVFIVLLLLSIFALILIIQGCYFDEKQKQ